jgi:NAD(P)-dependent dehydrogenase (short-subunit alcohol dehydrogenase family)
MVRIEGEPVKRTYVVTGAASGIGAATAKELAQTGARVISCDLHDADVTADLATPGGVRSSSRKSGRHRMGRSTVWSPLPASTQLIPQRCG